MALPGRVLLIDNSRAYATIVSSAIADRLGIEVSVADSLASARQLVEQWGDQILLVLSGLVLPDADEASVVHYFTHRRIPLVVVTGVFDHATRERILAQPVIDYVLKDNPSSVDYLVWLVQRISRNRALTALVIDDSNFYRGLIGSLLKLYGFAVLEAADGEAGLELIKANPQLSLVICDFELPGISGIQVVRRIRGKYARDRLAVIGVSASESVRGPISAQFIKSGANDFLHKPFLPEELFCRVAQNVENLENIASLRHMATTDPLTGLRNRRSFFDTAQRRFQALGSQSRSLAVAMMDIDHFKKVNDGHGHDCGDAVLVGVSRLLAASLRDDDLVARFGGEEFCVLFPDLDESKARKICETLRNAIESTTITFGDAVIPVTISIGLCSDRRDSLHGMLTQADQALYRAKAAGRNRVMTA
ncbi:GGDEF domain-containing response regulator [Paramagnetospirillum kuznetsovii]|nr:diguanylate cyclase [Paramagnetospirillum kuznetsovii]